jgi:hypothetical protein
MGLSSLAGLEKIFIVRRTFYTANSLDGEVGETLRSIAAAGDSSA